MSDDAAREILRLLQRQETRRELRRQWLRNSAASLGLFAAYLIGLGLATLAVYALWPS